MKVIGEKTRLLYEHPYQVSNTVKEITSDIILNQNYVRNIRLCDNYRQLDSIKGEIDQRDKVIRENFKIVLQKFLGPNALANSTFFAYSELKNMGDKFYQLKKENKTDSIQILLNSDARVKFDKTILLLTKISDFADNKANTMFKNVIETENNATRLTMILIIIAGLLILFFNWFLTRSIINPIKNFVSEANILLKKDEKVLITADEHVMTQTLAELKNAYLRIERQSSEIELQKIHLAGINLELEDKVKQRTSELFSANQELAIQYEFSRYLAFIVESSDDAIISKSLDGNIRSWNLAAEKMFGYTAEEAIGENISLIIPADYINDEKAILDKLQKGEIIENYETTRIRKNSEQFHVSLTVSPIRNSEGKITGVSKIIRDITRKNEMVEELNKQNSMINTLLANLQIGVYMIEVPSGIPLLANESSFNLLGRGILPEANSGTIAKVYDLYKTGTDIPYPNEELPLIVAMSGVSKHVDDMEVKKPDGTRTALEVFGSPIRDNSGNIWASLVSFQDITDRKQAEQALKKSEDFLFRTGEIARVGGWEMDLDQNKAIWTRTAAEIHELPGTSEIDLDKAFNYFHPDDKQAVRNYVDAAIKAGESFEYEARLVTAKGNERWIRSIGVPVLVSGKCHFVSGIVHDITERKQVEEEIKTKVTELERFNRLSVGRELRVIELKQKINDLSSQLKLPQPYAMDYLKSPEDIPDIGKKDN